MMIARQPVLVLSLAIVALVVLAGVRGVVGGVGFTGGWSMATMGTGAADAAEPTPAVVENVFAGDTVEVTSRRGRQVRVRLLGISAPELPRPGKPGECYGHRSTRGREDLGLFGLGVREEATRHPLEFVC